jgi:hypothetical protein
MRFMTDEERIEVGRMAHEPLIRHGRGAHVFAEKCAKEALESGDNEGAVFWGWIAASLLPR